MKKIVLAYSGGLDTSCMIKWLIENYDAEIITVSVDLGQGEDPELLKERALKTGATKAFIVDQTQRFLEDFCFKSLKAGAVYEGKYLLATALSRPLIAECLVEIAVQEKAWGVAHGCTGKGNDQVRFELAISALNPHLKILAPHREWDLKLREVEIEYARSRRIPVEATRKSPYSIDSNLWGTSVECGILEDPEEEPPEDVYRVTRCLKDTPDKPTYIEIGFEKGIPISLNGRTLDSVTLVKELNRIGGEHGVGRKDLIENRLVGIKSREIYEFPAAEILYSAHRALEELVFDREITHFKPIISQKYGELIYYGLWYSKLREALDGFVNMVERNVTGVVRMKLCKGQANPVGRRSPFSLYRKDLATYEEGDSFDHKAAEGFIKIWGLPLQVSAHVQGFRPEER